jgi:hypothetical protein
VNVWETCTAEVQKPSVSNFWLYFYDQARPPALTSRNIKSGWAKAGLYRFDSNRILRDIQEPPTQECQSGHPVDPALSDEPLRTPVISAHPVSLRRELE